MQVAEQFISINGEGQRAGEPAVFVRFRGCNLACSYCDTRWANEPDCTYEEQTPEEIRDALRKTGIRNVTLTGGEPLLQPAMETLLQLLLKEPGLRVEIETNGSVDLEPYCLMRKQAGTDGQRLVLTMDYKLPSSGMESAMRPENFSCLQKTDTVKFVSGSPEDLKRALEMIKAHHLTERCGVHFSPVFGKLEPEAIVRFMIDNKLNDTRLQMQIHKIIWDPNQRGV